MSTKISDTAMIKKAIFWLRLRSPLYNSMKLIPVIFRMIARNEVKPTATVMMLSSALSINNDPFNLPITFSHHNSLRRASSVKLHEWLNGEKIMFLYVFETSSTVHVIMALCIMLYDWVFRCRFVRSDSRIYWPFPSKSPCRSSYGTICIAARLNYCESGNLGC